MRWLLAALAALALTGCESTQEKSAKLEQAAKRLEAIAHAHEEAIRRESTITRISDKVHVVAVTLLHSAEGAAVVVTLQNSSRTALREVPVGVSVRDSHGAQVYTNEVAGQAPPLIAVSYIPAHGRFEWIDDQVQASGPAVSATAKVGEGKAAVGSVPVLKVSGAHMIDDASSGLGAEGQIENTSSVSQQELVVYAVARRDGAVVAAGRAVIASAPAHSSSRFQLFFVGNPTGAKLEVAVPPSTLG